MNKRNYWLLGLFLLVTAFLAIACDSAVNTSSGKMATPPKTSEIEKKVKPTQPEVRKVTLYFSDSQLEYLVPEKRDILVDKQKGFYLQVVEALIRGPENKALTKTIPAEAKLLSFELQDKTAVLNFNAALRTKHWGGSTAETFTIYSLVNTLTQFPEIEKVTFTLEGKKIESLVGHVDLSEPLEKDETLLNK